MANTYSEITIQVIFAVRNRESLITAKWRDELHSYLTGIMRNQGLLPIAAGGWEDHVHLLFVLPVTKSIADVVRIMKASSSKWINDRKFVNGKFHWQEGYVAFSYSKNARPNLVHYIANQEEHHKTVSFEKENIQLLQDFEISYDPNYLFDFKPTGTHS